MNAKEIAKQIIFRFEEVGLSITNIVLQKLLYYSKGWSLGLHGEPCFKNAIHAWEWGPVVPAAYKVYEKFGRNAIQIPNEGSIQPDLLLDAVVRVYGQISPFELSDLTHEEDPWINNYVEGEKEASKIPDSDLSEFFAGPARDWEIHLHFLDIYGDLRLGVRYRKTSRPISPEDQEEIIKRLAAV